MQVQKIISKLIYGTLGSILTLGGLVAMFYQSAVLPESTGLTEGGIKILDNLGHIFQELGAAIFALGGLLIWGIFNFEKMKELNFILLLFFLPFAGFHWWEWLEGNRSLTSPLINSFPAVLILLVMYLNKK